MTLQEKICDFKYKNVNPAHKVRPPTLHLAGQCLTWLLYQLRHHLGVGASRQVGCSPVGPQLEGRARLWYCGGGSCSSLHLIENTKSHSCSAHPSGYEAMSDGGGGTDEGTSPHDRFHLFPGRSRYLLVRTETVAGLWVL